MRIPRWRPFFRSLPSPRRSAPMFFPATRVPFFPPSNAPIKHGIASDHVFFFPLGSGREPKGATMAKRKRKEIRTAPKKERHPAGGCDLGRGQSPDVLCSREYEQEIQRIHERCGFFGRVCPQNETRQEILNVRIFHVLSIFPPSPEAGRPCVVGKRERGALCFKKRKKKGACAFLPLFFSPVATRPMARARVFLDRPFFSRPRWRRVRSRRTAHPPPSRPTE